jgi:hypothetical protein
VEALTAHAPHHDPGLPPMTVGAALFCIAVGAILHFAVTADLAGIDIQTVGTILMIVGAVGFVIGLLLMLNTRSRGPTPPAQPPY